MGSLIGFCHPEKFNAHAYVHPGGRLTDVVQEKVKESVQELCHEEFVIVMEDTNDADSGRYCDSCFEINLAASTAHTNLIVISFPYWNDKLRVKTYGRLKKKKKRLMYRVNLSMPSFVS